MYRMLLYFSLRIVILHATYDLLRIVSHEPSQCSVLKNNGIAYTYMQAQNTYCDSNYLKATPLLYLVFAIES